MNNTDGWEKRWNPLRREWIVYAPHRNNRPWDGESEELKINKKSYLPNCYLCPGNERISGTINPNYQDVFVFDNDHPVVSFDAPNIDSSISDELYITQSAKGFAKVICYHPDHSKTMTDLNITQLAKILKAWKSVTKEARDAGLEYVLVFENKGEITGVSNLHPHCQVYATDFVFNHTLTELESLKKFREARKANLFESIIAAERSTQTRIIAENEYAIAFLPFFAKYAYEVMLFPKQNASTLLDLTEEALHGIAIVYHQLLQKYDALFDQSFPYVMSIMQAPLQENHPEYRLYFHFQPPLRIPNVRKYLAGPEIGGGNFMADTIPEVSAQQLKAAI
ncbi:MAG: galactose-1-phosphate uridylyltransferase [Bacteroidota bacterium]